MCVPSTDPGRSDGDGISCPMWNECAYCDIARSTGSRAMNTILASGLAAAICLAASGAKSRFAYRGEISHQIGLSVSNWRAYQFHPPGVSDRPEEKKSVSLMAGTLIMGFRRSNSCSVVVPARMAPMTTISGLAAIDGDPVDVTTLSIFGMPCSRCLVPKFICNRDASKTSYWSNPIPCQVPDICRGGWSRARLLGRQGLRTPVSDDLPNKPPRRGQVRIGPVAIMIYRAPLGGYEHKPAGDKDRNAQQKRRRERRIFISGLPVLRK